MRKLIMGFAMAGVVLATPHFASACQAVVNVKNEHDGTAKITAVFSRPLKNDDEGYTNLSGKRDRAGGRKFLSIARTVEIDGKGSRQIRLPLQRFRGRKLYLSLVYKVKSEIEKEVPTSNCKIGTSRSKCQNDAGTKTVTYETWSENKRTNYSKPAKCAATKATRNKIEKLKRKKERLAGGNKKQQRRAAKIRIPSASDFQFDVTLREGDLKSQGTMTRERAFYD